MPTWKDIRYTVLNERQRHRTRTINSHTSTYIEHCTRAFGRGGLGTKLLSQWVPILAPTHIRIAVHTARKSGRNRSNTVCDAPLSRSERRSFAPLQKSRRNRPSRVNRSPAIQYGFVSGQELSGMMWTTPKSEILDLHILDIAPRNAFSMFSYKQR